MLLADSSNIQFELAVQFVNNTAQNIFLTGKAGTGKTTFLRYITEHTHKKLAIIAPTGIAAINAGGVTMHSFFQLPFGSFLPVGSNNELPQGNFFNRYGLLKQLRLNHIKRTIIQELDLLIIDEVSMVRSDLLDAVDAILRYVKNQAQLPFGGVQMLFIGDLLQLPPVVNEEEWRVLKQYYESPFFFDAQVLKTAPPHYLELKKIYRQSDVQFIEVLNKLRNNKLQKEDLDFLNSFYRPDFRPELQGEYITLTSHNAQAEEINQRELGKLEGMLFTYQAEVTGNFQEKSVMAEVNLILKKGAQVMFIRNDKGEKKRYFNGKLGTVKKLDHDKIIVVFPETLEEVQVDKEVWKNIQYSYNSDSDAIQEEILGTFTQYPLRLAWAITIHKSQGLTFKKAIIDAGASFAAGQVYVALSRLTSLDGLVLYSKINTNCVNTDVQAIAYANCEKDSEALTLQLKEGKKEYAHSLLLKMFQMNSLSACINNYNLSIQGRKLTFIQEANDLANSLIEKVKDLHHTSEKFIKQLDKLLQQVDKLDYVVIQQRVEAATGYFTEAILKDISNPLEEHYQQVKKRKKVKQYVKELLEIIEVLKKEKDRLGHAALLTKGLATGMDPLVLLKEIRYAKKKEVLAEQENYKKPDKDKVAKGDTQKQSLQAFKEGKTIQEIALERGFAVTTIEGHLASFISTGEIQVQEFVKPEKLKTIQSVIEEMGDINTGAYKEKLGEEYSYGEIKAVINYLKAVSSKE